MAKIRLTATTGNTCARCGNPATHMTSNGVFWCSDETSRCPDVIATVKHNQKNLKPNPTDPVKLEQKRNKISALMKARYASGWESTAGRCKKYKYFSESAGHISVDGTWEITFCQFADALKLQWHRNKKRFSYIKPDGTHSTYQPDFFVDSWGIYVEVKGYETKLDHAKWSQFNEPLLILRKTEIGKMAEWTKAVSC